MRLFPNVSPLSMKDLVCRGLHRVLIHLCLLLEPYQAVPASHRLFLQQPHNIPALTPCSIKSFVTIATNNTFSSKRDPNTTTPECSFPNSVSQFRMACSSRPSTLPTTTLCAVDFGGLINQIVDLDEAANVRLSFLPAPSRLAAALTPSREFLANALENP